MAEINLSEQFNNQLQALWRLARETKWLDQFEGILAVLDTMPSPVEEPKMGIEQLRWYVKGLIDMHNRLLPK